MDPKNQIIYDNEFRNNFSDFPGIIHDVKNLMCAVIYTAESLTLEVPDGHPFCKKIQTIIQIIQQCIELLASSQSTVNSCKLEKIDLESLIDEAISLLKFSIENRISVETIYNYLNPVISGNRIELESALLNIFINAIESMSEGGIVRIRVSPAERQEYPDFCNSVISEKLFIKIEISDTGTGIAPENIASIFDPFYSTKQTPGASKRGLGLSRAKQCICTHGGTIEVQSALSQGTTFTILLPVSES